MENSKSYVLGTRYVSGTQIVVVTYLLNMFIISKHDGKILLTYRHSDPYDAYGEEVEVIDAEEYQFDIDDDFKYVDSILEIIDQNSGTVFTPEDGKFFERTLIKIALES